MKKRRTFVHAGPSAETVRAQETVRKKKGCLGEKENGSPLDPAPLES